jgi:hypothetical protein
MSRFFEKSIKRASVERSHYTDLSTDYKIILKWILKDWVRVTHGKKQSRVVVNTNHELPISIKCEVFLD